MSRDVPATAEGDLGRTPFAHLLAYAVDRSLTGELFFTEPSLVTHVLQLARGLPVKVRPGDRYALLGELLLETQAVQPDVLERALGMRGLLGDVLVLTGSVDRELLEHNVQRQFLMRMVRLFSLPAATTYRYVDGSAELAEWGGDPASVDPLAVIAAGLREHAAASTMMEPTLDRLGDAVLRLHPSSAVERFRFDREERRVVALVQAAASEQADLLGRPDLVPDVVRRVLYALVVTRHLDMGLGLAPVGVERSRERTDGSGVRPLETAPKAAASPAAAQAPPPPPPSAPSPLPPPPGVPAAPAAPLARVQLRAAVHRLGAAAPDTPGDGERAPVAPRSRRRDRRDDEPPSERMNGSSRPPPGPPRTDPTLPVTALIALAEERLQEKDFEGALDACNVAIQREADPDFVAFSVLIRASMQHADIKALAVELDELLRANAHCVAARYCRGLLRKRLGDSAGALRDFHRVVELDPVHAQALQLIQSMEPAKAKHGPGILSRLFKR